MRKYFDLKEINKIKSEIFSDYSDDDPKIDGADLLTSALEQYWDKKFDISFDKEQFTFFLKKLDEPIALLSFGEGEISFVQERKSVNNREIYTEEARDGLIDAIRLSSLPNVYLTTILGSTSDRTVDTSKNRDFMRFISNSGGEIKEELYSAKIFYDLLHRAYLKDKEYVKDFIKKLRTKKVCIIGDKSLSVVLEYLNDSVLVTTPNLGATCWLSEIKKKIKENKADVYLFSCGIAGNCLIADLFQETQKPMIDVGCFWDMLIGIGTRREEHFDPPLLIPEQI